MTEYIQKHWREVNSRTSCAGPQSATGIKDFRFSVGAGYGWIPSQSYFRVNLKLVKIELTGAEGVPTEHGSVRVC